MTLHDALRAVQAVIAGNPSLRIATHGMREDDAGYLIPVLDRRQMDRTGNEAEPSASQLLLVHKASGQVERLTVADALARSRSMRPATDPR